MESNSENQGNGDEATTSQQENVELEPVFELIAVLRTNNSTPKILLRIQIL